MISYMLDLQEMIDETCKIAKEIEKTKTQVKNEKYYDRKARQALQEISFPSSTKTSPTAFAILLVN